MLAFQTFVASDDHASVPGHWLVYQRTLPESDVGIGARSSAKLACLLGLNLRAGSLGSPPRGGWLRGCRSNPLDWFGVWHMSAT